MALFAVIGDSFIKKILKQVAFDYELDYEEMKARYCGESSFEQIKKSKKLVIDLEVPVPEPVDETEVEKPEEPVPLKALSKMKKTELVKECEIRDLNSEGTVIQLKERIKEARESESTKKTKKVSKPKKNPVPDPKKKPVTKKILLSPPPPPILEEEKEDENDKDICTQIEEEEELFEEEDIEDDLQSRLRKILAEAEEEEE